MRKRPSPSVRASFHSAKFELGGADNPSRSMLCGSETSTHSSSTSTPAAGAPCRSSTRPITERFGWSVKSCVTRAVEILDRIGYSIKGPGEVREQLGLTKHG